MKDDTLAEQILKAAEDALSRAKQGNPGISKASLREVVAAYMSGVNQAASVIVRGEGEVDAYQVQRAVRMAGERIGLRFALPNEPEPPAFEVTQGAG